MNHHLRSLAPVCNLKIFNERKEKEQTEIITEEWVKIHDAFQLTTMDKAVILNEEALTDRIIDAAQLLIDDVLQNENQSCLLKQSAAGKFHTD